MCACVIVHTFYNDFQIRSATDRYKIMNTSYSDNQEKRPPQHQAHQPGSEHNMTPRPVYIRDDYRGSGKLTGKVALITGGDSGIGRAVSVHFAIEGADIAVVYKDEEDDAHETRRLVGETGRHCLLLRGDVADEDFCRFCVQETLDHYQRLDILVNNAGEQHPQDRPEEISSEQMRHTFATNFFAYFYLVQAALPHLSEGASIINTTSVTAYRGSSHLIDYAASKGAIVAFTRSLSAALVKDRGIRVNGVAPGPIWTPLIPASFDAAHVEEFGSDTPMGRAGQPAEVAPCYVFLASDDASYMSGQVFHPNGGDFIST
jgi:NAD(P)-dependent dehydrogenase (short-subunit alcohol dehydrogenase family)